VLGLAGIDDPKLDSTASHPSSWSHSLPRHIVCHPAQTIMGGLGLRLRCPCFIGRQSVSVSATVTAVSEPSVSAVASVTAITGLQLRRHFRLRPKPEKNWFRSVSMVNCVSFIYNYLNSLLLQWCPPNLANMARKLAGARSTVYKNCTPANPINCLPTFFPSLLRFSFYGMEHC